MPAESQFCDSRKNHNIAAPALRTGKDIPSVVLAPNLNLTLRGSVPVINLSVLFCSTTSNCLLLRAGLTVVLMGSTVFELLLSTARLATVLNCQSGQLSKHGYSSGNTFPSAGPSPQEQSSWKAKDLPNSEETGMEFLLLFFLTQNEQKKGRKKKKREKGTLEAYQELLTGLISLLLQVL